MDGYLVVVLAVFLLLQLEWKHCSYTTNLWEMLLHVFTSVLDFKVVTVKQNTPIANHKPLFGVLFEQTGQQGLGLRSQVLGEADLLHED